MYTKLPKKLMIINILDILRKYTDKEHPLSITEIKDILEDEYYMTVDRKAVRRNLLNLCDFGYQIEYSEKSRTMPIKDSDTGEIKEISENTVLYDFYLNRDFDDSELRLLIDSLVFSRNVPYKQCKDLIGKLENLSNVYFHSKVKHISRMPDDKTDNKQLFYNIDILDEAISNGKKVAFKYIEYGIDKKIHIKKCADGTERKYIVSPYQMAAKEGKYYLICNYDKYNDISNYRVDRICDIEILDEPVKPFETLNGSNGKPLDLTEYMKSHVYMYSSDNLSVTFRITRPMISDIIDMFQKDVNFREDEDGIVVSTYTNRMAMEQFAKSYAPDVIILKPQDLADKVKTDMEKALQKYNS